jgi:host factor-I protein
VIDTEEAAQSARKAEANTFNGTRKLIRPHLPVRERRYESIHTEDPLSHAMQETLPSIESSHAEAFYFQKQIQQQTEMTFILEDGEELSGHLEWYDRCVIKLRSGRKRVLIYKAAIKYLFKSSEARPTDIMK